MNAIDNWSKIATTLWNLVQQQRSLSRRSVCCNGAHDTVFSQLENVFVFRCRRNLPLIELLCLRWLFRLITNIVLNLYHVLILLALSQVYGKYAISRNQLKECVEELFQVLITATNIILHVIANILHVMAKLLSKFRFSSNFLQQSYRIPTESELSTLQNGYAFVINIWNKPSMHHLQMIL